MKKNRLIFVVGLCLFFFPFLTLHAQDYGYNKQRTTLVSGDFSLLKGEPSLNTEYTYDGLLVGDMPEEEYTSQKIAKYNKDEPGKGDEWLKNWNNDKVNRYQPKFEEAMTDNLKKEGIKVGPDKNAKYTLILKTRMIEPGYNAAISSQPSYVNVDVTIVETANRSNVIAKARITKSPGNGAGGFGFTSGLRIQESYQNCAKFLTKLMKKNGLKNK